MEILEAHNTNIVAKTKAQITVTLMACAWLVYTHVTHADTHKQTHTHTHIHTHTHTHRDSSDESNFMPHAHTIKL